jgi:hypothetical protein
MITIVFTESIKGKPKVNPNTRRSTRKTEELHRQEIRVGHRRSH